MIYTRSVKRSGTAARATSPTCTGNSQRSALFHTLILFEFTKKCNMPGIMIASLQTSNKCTNNPTSVFISWHKIYFLRCIYNLSQILIYNLRASKIIIKSIVRLYPFKSLGRCLKSSCASHWWFSSWCTMTSLDFSIRCLTAMCTDSCISVSSQTQSKPRYEQTTEWGMHFNET